jgi:hypothetical protein
MATFTATISEIMGHDYTADVSRIGLDKYPIFDNGYRPVLNEKIVMRYWTREIGVETIPMFQHHMRARLNEIMPFYNELYKTTFHDFDMFTTLDIVSTSKDTNRGAMTGETDSESTTGSTSTSKARAVSSDTPQVQLSNNGDYATAVQDSVSETGGTGESTGKDKTQSEQESTSEGENRTTGSQGSRAGLLMEFRQSILNVDVLILDQLEDLFMQVWSNGDDFTGASPFITPFYYNYPRYI